MMSFSALDTNNDGQISRAEWDSHMGARSGARDGAASGGATGNPATTDRTPASSPTGVTAGPGTVSPRTGPGSATATTPDTSGHGKPK